MTTKTYTITISDTDEKLLLSNVSDIQKWLDDAIAGKINHSWKIFKDEWVTTLMADESVTTIPATKEELVNTVTLRSDYKDRATKDSAFV